jgi:transcriptional regulator with XRE-family HTH domain
VYYLVNPNKLDETRGGALHLKRLECNIRSIIQKNGLKQKAVAESAGLNERQLSDMLNGRMRISPDVIDSLCEILHTDPNTLFGYQGGGTSV